MLTISRRDARIGNGMNWRTEYHGDEPVRATDIPVSGVMLNATELGEILQEPHAFSVLFVTPAPGEIAQPVFKAIKPLQLADKIESANVTLYLGALNAPAVSLGVCKLKGVKLEPKAGGLTELSCQIQSTPTLDKRIADLVDHMGDAVQVSFTYEHNPEQKALEVKATVTPIEAAKGVTIIDGTTELSRMGQQINAATKPKRARKPRANA